MKDKIFGKHNECPNCGSTKGLYYAMQYPMFVNVNLNGKPFVKRNGKRVTQLSNRTKGAIFDYSVVNFECAVCTCEECGWTSEPIVP